MKSLVFISLLFLVEVIAIERVHVSAEVNRADYQNKSIEFLQEMAINKAKLKAASQIFGDYLSSITEVDNGKLLKDLIIAKQGGVLHIEGDPKFSNGRNLGDLRVDLKVYANENDLDVMKVKRVSLKDFKYRNDDLSAKELKNAAIDAFILELVSQKKPILKTYNNGAQLAKELVLNTKIEKIVFDPYWMAYIVSGYIEYIPLFLQKNKLEMKAKKTIATKVFLSVNGGAKKFSLIYNKEGIVFSQRAIKYLRSFTKKEQLFLIISADMKVPNNIKSKFVNVQTDSVTNNSWRGQGSYKVELNGINIIQGGSEQIEVKSSQRNIKLNIKIRCYKNNFHRIEEKLIEYLKNLSFEISDDMEEYEYQKLLPIMK